MNDYLENCNISCQREIFIKILISNKNEYNRLKCYEMLLKILS